MQKKHKYFVTGIGTEVGKTICSAVLVSALNADYWKPIQSGDLDSSDSMLIRKLVKDNIQIHPERHRLKLAASPHKSARLEGKQIELTDFEIPKTDNHLIVEGAGGLFVPISDSFYIRDLIQKLGLPIVLIAKNYLGCINHTLLTIKALEVDHIEIAYFIFNGDFDKDTEDAILNYLNPKTKILHFPNLETLDKIHIQKIAKQIKTIQND